MFEYTKNMAKPQNDARWIPVTERLPDPETEVLITARRKYTGGKFVDIVTTAIFEDGTILENDSIWNWYEIDGKYDEENDCYIIPEGWWENRHYNPDEVYNNIVDDKVIAWMPLPEPYKVPKMSDSSSGHCEKSCKTCKYAKGYSGYDDFYCEALNNLRRSASDDCEYYSKDKDSLNEWGDKL